MKLKSLIFPIGMLIGSFALTACCQQPGYNGGHNGGSHQASGGNCHTHNENASRGSTRHCHPHQNGASHSHQYGQKPAARHQQPRYQQPEPYPRAMAPSVKNKGYYKGTVGDMMNQNTRQALERYSSY